MVARLGCTRRRPRCSRLSPNDITAMGLSLPGRLVVCSIVSSLSNLTECVCCGPFKCLCSARISLYRHMESQLLHSELCSRLLATTFTPFAKTELNVASTETRTTFRHSTTLRHSLRIAARLYVFIRRLLAQTDLERDDVSPLGVDRVNTSRSGALRL